MLHGHDNIASLTGGQIVLVLHLELSRNILDGEDSFLDLLVEAVLDSGAGGGLVLRPEIRIQLTKSAKLLAEHGEVFPPEHAYHLQHVPLKKTHNPVQHANIHYRFSCFNYT